MGLSEQYNVGARITVIPATTSISISQSSAAGATTQDGLTIDRYNLARRYYSCKAAFAASFTAANSSRTATLSLNFQHSSDGTSWDNYSTQTIPTAVTFGADTGGTTDYDRVEQSVNLNGARRYLRMQVPVPTFATSSSGMGVFSGQGVIVFGGGDEVPATT